MNKVAEYIEKNWDLCIKNNQEDNGTLIGLPYPYTVPAVGQLEEMYYWDTYFTNKGLEEAGRYIQAKNNTDNILYLVKKYGFMPNGNRTYYLGKSQPPFLSLMVSDVYAHYLDKDWLKNAYETLKIEYDFWMSKRCADIGLNFYDSFEWNNNAEEWAKGYKGRVGYMPDLRFEDISRHYLATCESGWDISPRWGNECYHYASVDLNSLMWMFEEKMSCFSRELANGETEEWIKRAADRKALMLKYMIDGEGIFRDYNYKSNTLSNIFSAASFYPLFVKLADQRHADALLEKLRLLETDHGILSCEKNEMIGKYQWDYPNGWACLQYIVMTGLNNYGYKKEANRIADKFVTLVEKVFEETGNIWEKYNVVDGNINVVNEYDMPPMMGWTAGVYLCAKKMKESVEDLAARIEAGEE